MGQFVVSRKSPEFVPVTPMLKMTSGTVPLLVIVTACSTLVELTV